MAAAAVAEGAPPGAAATAARAYGALSDAVVANDAGALECEAPPFVGDADGDELLFGASEEDVFGVGAEGGDDDDEVVGDGLVVEELQ